MWNLVKPFQKVIGPGEAQRVEPGINQLDACGPTCVSAIMQCLGYPDIEPQDLVGANYRGGTTAQQLIGMMSKYPNPPNAFLAGLGDWDLYGESDVLGVALFHCDGNAVLQSHFTGIEHWCIPLANDDTGITLFNPEWATYEHHPYNFISAAYAGAFVVINRAIMIQSTATPLEDHMQNFGPTDQHTYIPGVYTGKPGTYAKRDMYLSFWHDSDFGPGVSVDVLYVPHDFAQSQKLTDRVSLSMSGSEARTIRVPDGFDGAIVIKHTSGDKYNVAVKTEYPA